MQLLLGLRGARWLSVQVPSEPRSVQFNSIFFIVILSRANNETGIATLWHLNTPSGHRTIK